MIPPRLYAPRVRYGLLTVLYVQTMVETMTGLSFLNMSYSFSVFRIRQKVVLFCQVLGHGLQEPSE
jgi:hypothetical protein